MKVLICGATGTLGRQIAKRALDEGYEVYCMVRGIGKATFLKEWGAELILGNLCNPKSLKNAVRGMDAVIDAATARPTDSAGIRTIDWAGKVALIQAAEEAQVKRFVFFSIMNAGKYPHVPMMDIKRCTEEFLARTSMETIVLRPGGFYQGLIGQFAIPILEQQPVWLSKDAAPIAHMDTQDIAKFAVKALALEDVQHQAFDLAGPKAWNSTEIIEICEKNANKTAKVTQLPLKVIRTVQKITRFFEWGINISDRLAFTEVVTSGLAFDAPMEKTYERFDLSAKEIVTLESYFDEYFNRILKKLKELDYDKPKSPKRTPFKSTSN